MCIYIHARACQCNNSPMSMINLRLTCLFTELLCGPLGVGAARNAANNSSNEKMQMITLDPALNPQGGTWTQTHNHTNSLLHFLSLCIHLFSPLHSVLLWGEEAGWISAGVRVMLAVNNRGIINRSLHSNYEGCSFSQHSEVHTYTHKGIQSISKVSLSSAYENGTS